MGFLNYPIHQFAVNSTGQHKMTRILLLLVFHIALISCGIVKNASSWMRDVEKGKIPEMTPEQHVMIFGGMLENMPDPSRWPEDADKGRLPVTTLSDEHKILLFGDKVAMRFSPNLTDSPRSINDFLEHSILQFISPVSGQVTSLNVSQILSDETTVEGRGRLKKILIPVLLAMTLIAAIVLPALLTVIKLIAVKGLWSGVVSLIISKLLGLKALLNHHHHHEDVRRPYVVYAPHGKYRRDEEENLQDPRQPYEQWGSSDNYEHWSRNGPDTNI